MFFSTRSASTGLRPGLRSFWTATPSVRTHGLRVKAGSFPPFSRTVFKAAGVASLGLGMSTLAARTIYCDPITMDASSKSLEPVTDDTEPVKATNVPPPPTSSVSIYELSFGTVSGICAGAFIKKGATIVAFCLGGIFVLLQFLGSQHLITVNWPVIASRFENLFYTIDPASGKKKPPTVWSLWNWLVGFLLADFPPRASFLAGLVLGLRIA